MKKRSSWNYYSVKIIKQIIVEGPPDLTLTNEPYEEITDQSFEESIMLVRAQSFDHAYKIAIRKSTEYDEPYYNIFGQKVTWKYIDAVDCYLIMEDEVGSGTEVYSCFHHVGLHTTPAEFLATWFNSDEVGAGFDKPKNSALTE